MKRHEYQLKWWAQLWHLALGVGTGVLGVMGWWVAANAWDSPTEFWEMVLFAVFMTAMGAFFSSLALRSKLVLAGTRISVRNAFGEKSADFRDVEGYRISVTKNASFWQLELRSGDQISIMRMFDVDDDFRAFLSRLKNLDEQTAVLGLN
jgi:hypothetical protein